MIKQHWHPKRGCGLNAWENEATGARWEGAPPTLPRTPASTWRASAPRLAAVDALADDGARIAAATAAATAAAAAAAAAAALADAEKSPPPAAAAPPAPPTLWHRTTVPPFLWVCAATGAVRARDHDLPTGAVTTDGWALQRDGEGDRWWWHEEAREAVWRGPWAAAERAALIRAARERRRERRGGKDETAEGPAAPTLQ